MALVATPLVATPLDVPPTPEVENPSTPATAAAVAWKNLKVVAKGRNRVLLKEVSGQVVGGFWAVMGPSGSGKSTLLNTLALRMDRGVTISGDMRLNGRPYTNAELKLMSGYVMQDDLLNANLTCEETLLYTAKLRCPQDATDADRQQRVDAALKQMGLEHARHTIVGSPLKKGVSGGERKRLCVALELLTEPRLLFLDEPTSGLDSVTALSLCMSLKALTSKIFNLFDNLILLKAGAIVYQGPTDQALAFFEANGFPCPALTNPADHLLDSMAADINDSTHSIMDVSKHTRFRQHSVDLHLGSDKPMVQLRETTPWIRQFQVLLDRSLREHARNHSVMLTQLTQTIIMAILIGTVFMDIGTSQASAAKRQALAFFMCINQGVFGALSVINNFPGERMLALRERAAGTYYASAYFLAKITAETIFQLPLPIIFSCIVYFIIGYQHDASKFFIFMGVLILCSLSATSLALMVSAICRTTDLSVTVLPMALEVCRLFGGFFLSPKDLPGYFSWLDALSYVKYSFVALSLNEERGLEYTCTAAQEITVNGVTRCPIETGDDVLVSKGMQNWSIGGCCGVLVSYIIITRFFAYLGVRIIKW